MFKFASLFTAIALTVTPVLADTVVNAPVTFEKAGHRYTYTVSYKKDYRVIEGVDETSRRYFTLYVGKHNVWGTVNGSYVEFSLKSVDHTAFPELTWAN